MIQEFVNISINNKNLEKKYNLKIGDSINIKTKTLSKGSHINVLCKCDICNTEKIMMYKTYNKLIQMDRENKYYCQKCSHEKKKKTNKERYGVEHACQNKDIFEKVKKTNMEKYGIDIPAKLESFENKKVETNLKRYNVKYPQQNKEIRGKSLKTMLENYGVEYPIQNEKINIQIKETCKERYGCENPLQSPDIRKTIIEKINLNTIDKYKNIFNIINISDIEYEIECNKGHLYKIHKSLFNQRLKYGVEMCTVCNPITHQFSDMENKLSDFITENYFGEIIKNSFDIISPYQIDIYLPDLNLAFEFNGIYWHSEKYKEDNYHLMKSNLCEDKEIQLIHIWEDDWNFKQDIIKSMILNKLGKTPNKIFARKCEIKEINDNKLVKEFLEKNHIQGFINSSAKIGLFYKNELVSLMTFGKKRNFMNSSSKENEYELLRFCNKLNTNIIGGASKLFKYFITKYKPENVLTYADRSHSNGNLYEKLGFEFVSKTKPNYYYIIDGVRNYRFNFRKDILVKKGFDKNKSEHEIMLERKIYRIYNAGNLKFIFKNFDLLDN